MIKANIYNYLCTTPYNTNPEILDQFINGYKDTIIDFYENRNLTKVNDFLYTMKVNKWDYSVAPTLFDGKIGACSSLKKGNFLCRNYDWHYDKHVEYVIQSKGYGKRHSSLGVAAGSSILEYDNPKLLSYSDWYEVAPIRLLDGINDCGFACNTNVTANGDHDFTTGTNPKKPTIYGLNLTRYLLDYAESAEMAIDLVKNINLIDGLEGIPMELHFMVTDKDYTYVIETIDNKIQIIEDFVDDKPIMTNFYLSGFDGTKESLTPFGAGFERYNILANSFDSITDVASAMQVMQSVNYTNAYKSTNPYWYSEFVGDYTQYGLGILTNKSPEEDFAPVIAATQQMYQTRQRDGQTWQTVHTGIYDLENKTLTLRNQEGEVDYEYTL